MDVPTTRDALLRRIRAAYDEFDAAVATIPPDRYEEAGAVGEWSVRDVLAHTSNPWLVAQLEAQRASRAPTALECYGSEAPPPPAEGADLSTDDGRNTWQRLRDLGLPLEAIRERTRDVRARLLALIEGLDDEELATPYTLAELGITGQLRPATEVDGFSVPLWRWIQGNSWHHHEAHAQDLRAFAEREQAAD